MIGWNLHLALLVVYMCLVWHAGTCGSTRTKGFFEEQQESGNIRINKIMSFAQDTNIAYQIRPDVGNKLSGKMES